MHIIDLSYQPVGSSAQRVDTSVYVDEHGFVAPHWPVQSDCDSWSRGTKVESCVVPGAQRLAQHGFRIQLGKYIRACRAAQHI